MTKLNIDIKDHKFRELLTYWRKVIVERLRRKQYHEDPRYGMVVLTRREFLKLLASLGVAGALASLGIGMFNAHWLWAQETTNPPPTPSEYNYGELNWLELTVKGTPLGRGLLTEYLFYEGGGTTVHDTSGNNRHGTITIGGNGYYEWTWLPNGKFILILGEVYPSKDTSRVNTKFDMGYEDWMLEFLFYAKWNPNINVPYHGWWWLFASGAVPGKTGYFICELRYDGKQILFASRASDTNNWRGFAIYPVDINPNGKWYHICVKKVGNEMHGFAFGSFTNSAISDLYAQEWTYSMFLGENWAWYIKPEYRSTTEQRGEVWFACVRMWRGEMPPDDDVKTLYKLAKLMVPYLP